MTLSDTPVIIDAVRTPVGRYNGALATVRADHLGAHVLNALIDRNPIEASDIDDVIFGCVTQIGEQSANVARTSLLGAGWPREIAGLTIDRKCGSSEAAFHIAAGFIAAGAGSLYVGGGVESMSRVPMGSNRNDHGDAFGWMVESRYELPSQGEGAERICDRWELTQEALNAYSLESHSRAANAADKGFFDGQIAPVPVVSLCERGADPAVELLEKDETIRRGSTMDKLASLKTSFRENGRITAGNSSQISDGAAALLVGGYNAANAAGLTPKAKIRAFATVGAEPELVLAGPVPATRKVLQLAGLDLGDIDLFEVNEAFAPVPLMWMKETGVSADKLNVNGGAIALGHPLGASGARLMTTLLAELERRDLRYGLQTMCANGGMATATIVERVT